MEFAEAHGGFGLADDEEALGRVIGELDNFRAAVSFAVVNGQADLALRLTTALQLLWHLYDVGEVGTWVAAAADMPNASSHPLGPGAHGQAALAATYRLDIPAREHHLSLAATYWEPYARAYLPASPEQGLADIRRAVALAGDDHPRARLILDTYNVLISAAAGEAAPESLERIRSYANEDPNHGLLLLRRTEAHLALFRDDHAAALAAYDDVIRISERAGRRSLFWVWACVPRLSLRFEVEPMSALIDARSYLVEARNAGSRRFVQCALARIAVMLAGVGRPEPAASLQAFTREPPGGAAMADGDPAELLTFGTLSPETLAAAHAQGARLSFDDAVQLALDELEELISARDNG